MIRRVLEGLAATLALALLPALPVAAQQDGGYGLRPLQVATDTYVLVGRTEDFSARNGGNIVNTAFVVTGEGVLVIDSGPTRRYGEELRRAIRAVTDEPVRELWLTHHHPDHILGNQAFADVPIAALPATAQGIRDEGEAFASNIYRLAGDWARGTEVLPASKEIGVGTRTVGRHRFRVLALTGHTAADLAVLDESTGVLFAGDLLFHDRAPTTPHADLAHWLSALDTLEALPAQVVVPGHGAPVSGARRGRPFAQTRSWLQWLRATLSEAADNGLDPAEIAARPIPEPLRQMALTKEELVRSLTHVYRQLETRAMRRGQ
jgi:quinoprotein relay system zinc metallohydrolase 1